MKEAFKSLHHIDYDDEVDDFYEEHLDKINQLKKERNEHLAKSAPLLHALDKVINSTKDSKDKLKELTSIIEELDEFEHKDIKAVADNVKKDIQKYKESQEK